MTTETSKSSDTGTAGEQTMPLHFTDAAIEKIKSFMVSQGKENAVLRVAIQGRSSSGFRYAIGITDPNDRDDQDIEFDGGGFPVLVDTQSIENLRGATVDYTEGPQGAGMSIENPNPVWRDELALQVQKILDEQINPGVASHGGVVELLDVKDTIAYVQLGGGCQGCGLADVTLKQGIEVMIKEAIPAITAVIDSTDHAAGANPFYQPSK